ncbi:MAG: Hpt domain-containing protein [Oscillospiraceae bacterium]
MTIQECYEALGGDFAQAERRLLSAGLVRKFIAKFLDDDSFSQLCRAMEDGRREEAFRAAHTLKGVSANLGFGRLLASAQRLTEALCPETEPIAEGAVPLLEEVRRDYESAVCAIRTYLMSAE